MKFPNIFNFPWQWDTAKIDGFQLNACIKRWRRGPVTFYMYQFNVPGTDDQFTFWSMYLWDGFGFAIHLPSAVINAFPKLFSWGHKKWQQFT